MGNRVQELLEMLYNMINEAWGIPLGAEKCVIERDKALDLIDEIKTNFPIELSEARRLVEARAEFIGAAKREAEQIRKTAEERARKLVEEQEIIRMAKMRSSEIIAQAEASAAELKRAASEFVDDAMRRSEESLSTALEELRKTRARFRSATATTRSRGAESSSFDVPMDD
jgi:cell division septum initiation protein DivIVA